MSDQPDVVVDEVVREDACGRIVDICLVDCSTRCLEADRSHMALHHMQGMGNDLAVSGTYRYQISILHSTGYHSHPQSSASRARRLLLWLLANYLNQRLTSIIVLTLSTFFFFLSRHTVSQPIMNADEIAAENRRKRTFKKFTYRGVEVSRSQRLTRLVND